MLHRTLWEESAPLAEACLRHPFVRGLADGSLDRAAFRRYVAQDGYFLGVFLRAYALLAARSVGREDAGELVGLQQGAMKELRLHDSYAARLGIDLAAVRPYRATAGYCDFLLASAWHRPAGVALAGMTPCMRLYSFLGTELARGGIPEHDYSDWIRTYSGEAFGGLAERIEALLDRTAEETPEVRDTYRYALRCEAAFFTAALEGGP
ncbi:MAG: TenA family protein [Acidobacteria bacterium]|nr:TenA family protein [Acidobacteriota bacterium]